MAVIGANVPEKSARFQRQAPMPKDVFAIIYEYLGLPFICPLL